MKLAALALATFALPSSVVFASGSSRPKESTPTSRVRACEGALASTLDRLQADGCELAGAQARVRALFEPYLAMMREDRQTLTSGGTLPDARLVARDELCQATRLNFAELLGRERIVCSRDSGAPWPSGDTDGRGAGAQTNSNSGRGGRSGVVYTEVSGTTTVGSDGTVYTRVSDTTTVGSDGTVYTRVSDTTTVGSDGTVYTNVGNTTIGSDGTVCTQTGTTTLCN